MSYTLNYGIFSPFKLAAKIEEETNQTANYAKNHRRHLSGWTNPLHRTTARYWRSPDKPFHPVRSPSSC